ncbi:MAG: hypothetical protein COZ05_13415 [Armatimonadetes bacterium CG_4_10_14_3_um_filter_59_10]|nr:MAG: hypothetical protein COZ05_13415 [Armatimonadetes bacterium CG_4_10_14_3_um_filter_59_10]
MGRYRMIWAVTAAAAFAALSPLRQNTLADDQLGTMTFYISPVGNDAWSGRLEAPNKSRTDGPFASLSRARDAVRAYREKNPEIPCCVVLRGGMYFLPEPFVLTPEDSGTASAPVEYCAYPNESPVVSAGIPVSGFRKVKGNLWVADVPRQKVEGIDLRQLRIGEERQIRARTPNFDPKNPYTGGWFFTRFPPGYSGRGFGTTVACIHNSGDFLEWQIDIPADGDYRFLFFYGALNQPFGRDKMDDRTQLTIDGGEPTLVKNLSDTGGWTKFGWSDTCATLPIKRGKHLLRWTNNKGGGLNLDAFILTDDPDYKPEGIIPSPPAAGKHLVLCQCEDFAKANGPELQITKESVLPAHKDHFNFMLGEVKSWAGIEDAEAYVFPAWGWVSARAGIHRVDEAKAEIHLDPPGSEQEIRIGNRYYLESYREALDAPGEWFFDRAESRLYFMAKSTGFEKDGVVLSAHDRAIHLKGDAAKQRFVEHVTFRGITFADTSYTARITNVYYPEDAAVWLENANHCAIRDCRFICVGGYAVKIAGDSKENRVLKNDVPYPGEGGVFCAGSNEVGPAGNLVSGNTIHHGGCHYAHVGGTYMRTSSGNTISHNLIHHMPRYGISWKSGSADNVIEYNELRFLNLETNDTGGIECWMSGRGNVIRNNLITDVVGLKHKENDEEVGVITPTYTWGIYLDDQSSGTIVENNIVARTVLGGVNIHGGGDNVINNNIFVNGRDYQICYSNYGQGDKNNVVTRNICYWTNPEGQAILAHGFGVKVIKEANHNLYYNVGAQNTNNADSYTVRFGGPPLAFPQWQEKGFDVDSIIADPLFVDSARDNYSLRPNSPALRLGFKQIDTSRIGPKGYRDPP